LSSSVGRRHRTDQSCDGGEQSTTITYRNNANISQIIRRQLVQHVRIDFIVSKFLLVLTEAETTKPPADIHGRAPHGLPGIFAYLPSPSLRREFD
jgi:hypothetical protein